MGKLMIMPMQTESQFKICTSIARKIIAMHGDQHEIYVIVGKDWEERLAEMCPEIKRATFHHPNEELQKEWLARTGKNKNEVIANLCEDYIRVWNNPQRKIDMVDAVSGFLFGFKFIAFTTFLSDFFYFLLSLSPSAALLKTI